VVCVFLFPPEGGVFIGPWGSSTNLVEAVSRHVVAGQPSHVAGWPGGTTSTAFIHRIGLPLLMYTCVHLAAGRTNVKLGRPAPRPIRHGVEPTRSTCQIHPLGDDDFDIWSTSLCHPIKCSNLVPKLLKSNNH
jgi:hypothetical protein